MRIPQKNFQVHDYRNENWKYVWLEVASKPLIISTEMISIYPLQRSKTVDEKDSTYLAIFISQTFTTPPSSADTINRPVESVSIAIILFSWQTTKGKIKQKIFLWSRLEMRWNFHEHIFDIYMTHKTLRFVAIVIKNLKYLCRNGDETFPHIIVVDGQVLNGNVGWESENPFKFL